MMKQRTTFRWFLRGGLGLALLGAAVTGIRAGHHDAALAQSVAATPKGCLAAPKGFHGILAAVPDLNVQSPAGISTKNVLVLHSMQWGVGRGIASPTGGSSDRESSNPTLSEVTVTRLSDENDPLLFDASTEGKPTTWTLYIYSSVAQNGAAACESIELSNTLISGFSASSDGGRPSESLSLNFTKFTIHHFANNSTASYDVGAARGSYTPGS